MIKKTWYYNNLREEFIFRLSSTGKFWLDQYLCYRIHDEVWHKFYKAEFRSHELLSQKMLKLEDIRIPDQIMQEVISEFRNMIQYDVD